MQPPSVMASPPNPFSPPASCSPYSRLTTPPPPPPRPPPMSPTPEAMAAPMTAAQSSSSGKVVAASSAWKQENGNDVCLSASYLSLSPSSRPSSCPSFPRSEGRGGGGSASSVAPCLLSVFCLSLLDDMVGGLWGSQTSGGWGALQGPCNRQEGWSSRAEGRMLLQGDRVSSGCLYEGYEAIGLESVFCLRQGSVWQRLWVKSGGTPAALS